MVIQNNIAAMNSNRILGSVTNKQAKTSEKLASGYRINRAADDAAGLSISEKMRKQIRGLSKGIENSQAGVSLCQVADGALAEVHDMLQRITELSVQAANGTNSESDRHAIQQEINEIKTEIDRIGETTKFNELKVFAGESVSNESSTTMVHGIEQLSVVGTPTDPSIVTYPISASLDQGITIGNATYAWDQITSVQGNTMDSLIPGTYEIQHNNLKFQFSLADGSTLEDVVNSLQNVSVSMRTDTQTVEALEKIDSLILTPFNYRDNTAVMTEDEYFDFAEATHTITTTNDKIIIDGRYELDLSADPFPNDGNASTTYYDILVNDTDQPATCPVIFERDDLRMQMVLTLNPGATLNGVLAGLNGATFTLKEDTDVTVAYKEPEIQTGTNAAGNLKLEEVSKKLIDSLWIDQEGNINRVYEENGFRSDFVADSSNPKDMHLDFEIGDDGKKTSFTLMDYSKNLIQEILDNNNTISAGRKVALNFKYGDSTVSYFFEAEQDATLDELLAYMENVPLSSDYAYTEYRFDNTSVMGMADGNVGQTTTKYSFFDNLQGNTQTDGENPKVSHKRIWIQSGCDAGDGMCLEIDNMNTSILGIKNLDVSTINGANDALDAVDFAIQTVSRNRSKIGAQQNRLEHTIANEGNIVENTTAAESRIRDTDMASAMVEYSRNNILIQAGQSILVKANQSTQGVLSLLQ